ncbi:MAG: Hsp70 family protein, partial [Proteobacteria bacterium]
SNSLLGAAIDGQAHSPIPLDPFAKDPTILRSVLFFPDRHRAFYGAQAIQEFVKHDMEGRFVRSIKKFLPIRSFTGTQVGGRNLSLEEIIATFLGELRRRGNAHFNRDITSVLLGRPAKFSPNPEDDQLAQDRLEKAARIAGFQHVAFCPEPVAAAYDFKGQLAKEKLLLVADFGGGTSDFTVVKISREEYSARDVLSIGGVALAGDAFDGALMRKRIASHFGADVQYRAPFGDNVLTMPRYLMEKICSPADISLLRDRDTMEFFRNVQGWSLGGKDKEHIDNLFSLINEQMGFELFEEIERVKRALSKAPADDFHFRHSGIEVKENITRPDFDEYSQLVVNRILAALDATLVDAGVTPDQIDLVAATGGTARVPALHAGLVKRFGTAKIQEGNHFHSIVHGLVKMAAEGKFA